MGNTSKTILEESEQLAANLASVNNREVMNIKSQSHKGIYYRCTVCGEKSDKTRTVRKIVATYRTKKKLVCQKCNNLQSAFPEIAKELKAQKATDFKPHSNKMVEWICSKCQHGWSATINSRATMKSGCPRCAGKIPTPDNNLGVKCPIVHDYWDDDRSPSEFLPNDSRKVKLKCPFCREPFELKCRDISRLRGSLCKKCNSAGTSVLEKRVYHELVKIGFSVSHRKIIDGKEADLIINDEITLEIDSFYFHQDKFESDLGKRSFFIMKGYNPLNMRGNGLKPTSKNDIFYDEFEEHYTIMQKLIEYLSSFFHKIDLVPAREIYRNKGYLAQNEFYRDLCGLAPLVKNPLIKEYPGIEERWALKNTIPPQHISAGSALTVYLKCPKAIHPDFPTKIYNLRNTWFKDSSGCPRCADKGSCSFVESFAHTHPLLASNVLRFVGKNAENRTIENTPAYYCYSGIIVLCYCGRERHTILRNYSRAKTVGCRSINPETDRVCFKDAPSNPYYRG